MYAMGRVILAAERDTDKLRLITWLDLALEDAIKRSASGYSESLKQTCDPQEIGDVYCELSRSLGFSDNDANVPICRSGFSDTLIDKLNRVFAYILADVFFQTQASIASFGSRISSFEGMIEKIDECLLEYEERLSGSEIFSDPHSVEGIKKIAQEALTVSGKTKGTFVKVSTLEEILLKNPPRNFMKYHGVNKVSALLKIRGMDVPTVFSLSRHIEPHDWTETNYALFENLTAKDFEIRPVQIVTFDSAPPEILEHFKGTLPFSNDKVAGTLTAFPFSPSEENRIPRVRAFHRALHYSYEVNFYSRMMEERINGQISDGSGLGVALRRQLSDDVKIVPFFEPHRIVELIWFEKPLRDMEIYPNVPFPEQIKGMAFTLAIREGDDIKLSGVNNRITVLSKGREYVDSMTKTYFRLAPLIQIFGDIDIVEKILTRAYLSPEVIAKAIESGIAEIGVDAPNVDNVLKDHERKISGYSRKAAINAHRLTLEAIRNIWETVSLLNETRMEIIIPQQVKFTPDMRESIRNVNKRTGASTIHIREYSDKDHLKEILAQKPRKPIKKIIITTEERAKETTNLVEDHPELFKNIRLLNIKLPPDFENMSSQQKTLHQARIIMLGVLARLLEKEGTPEIEAILRGLLEVHLNLSGQELNAFIENLSISEVDTTGMNEIKERILYFLERPINLIKEGLERDLKFLREFWISA